MDFFALPVPVPVLVPVSQVLRPSLLSLLVPVQVAA